MKGRNTISSNIEGLACSQRLCWSQPGIGLGANRVQRGKCPRSRAVRGDLWISDVQDLVGMGGGGGQGSQNP